MDHPSTYFDLEDAVRAVRRGDLAAAEAARRLLASMTEDERLWILDGDVEFWPGMFDMMTKGFCHTPCVMGAVPRLKLPGVRFTDGPRGCIVGKSTAFPVAMARGASWDVRLEERVGKIIGLECKAQGANLFGGVCVNVPRFPQGGRIQETYGEDPIILGNMGAATVRGVEESVMVCVKHFALNSIENARFKVDVQVADDIFHELYLPHFQQIVQQGVSSVMSAYNSVRGHWAGQSKELLIDILRRQWGFKGFVIEDFIFGFRDVALSLQNGLDLEAPFRQMRAKHLKTALEENAINRELLERSGINILQSLITNEVKRGGSRPGMDVVFSKEHRELARESATRSMVLLKNDIVGEAPILPIDSDISSVAVVGWLANSTNTGDKGSSAVRCPEVVSAYKGIKEALPETKVILEESNDLKAVAVASEAAEVVVVVVGYDYRDEGEYTAPAFNATPGLSHVIPPNDGSPEAVAVLDRLITPKPKKDDQGKDNYGFGAGGDRKHLNLRPDDVEVIKAATKANLKTIVAIVSGGPVITSDFDKLTPALLYMWYAGCEGGRAIADLILGKKNFSGHLPFSVPTTKDHLPLFDGEAESVAYDRWYGQRLIDRLGVEAAYPLGYGLSYTTFALTNLSVEPIGKDLQVTFQVRNSGHVDGMFVGQVYGVVDIPDWPLRSLLGFETVELKVEECKEVKVMVSSKPLRRWADGKWELVTASVTIEVGQYSGDRNGISDSVKLES